MECCEHTAAVIASEDMAAVRVDMAEHPDHYADAPDPKRPNTQFEPTDDIKKVLIDPQGSSAKTVTISSALSECLRRLPPSTEEHLRRGPRRHVRHSTGSHRARTKHPTELEAGAAASPVLRQEQATDHH